MTKTWTKFEDNTHKHQTIPQTSHEYFQGIFGEMIKITGKLEANHSSTNANNKHKYNCEQGYKRLETGQ